VAQSPSAHPALRRRVDAHEAKRNAEPQSPERGADWSEASYTASLVKMAGYGFPSLFELRRTVASNPPF
jgi:hypothetical protein